MYRILQILFVALCLVISAHVVGSRAAEDLGPLIDQLGSAKLSDMDDHITALAETGDAKVVPVLEALGEGNFISASPTAGSFWSRRRAQTCCSSIP